jgi:hypothetical protein
MTNGRDELTSVQICRARADLRAKVDDRQVTWNFLGPLQGYEHDNDSDREPGVDAATIISTLTGDPPLPAI